MLQNTKIAEAEENEVCANCGKEGSSDVINNTCNKCKSVMYCNAACKKKHRHKHKKDCEEHLRLAAELHDKELKRVAKLYDEALFKQPPPNEDCPICFLRMPLPDTGVPTPATVEDRSQRIEKRIEAGDPIAIFNQGCDYRDGTCGFPQDYTKALELWHKAGELGYPLGYNNVGRAYSFGEGVEVNKKKAKHYYELSAMLSAMAGNEVARHNLGCIEVQAGNIDKALRHFMIAVGSGYSGSLKVIKVLYKNGKATKDDYTKALRSHQVYLDEVKSVQRDEAAAFDDDYKYIE